MAARRPPSYITTYITLVVALAAAILFVIVLGGIRGFTASDRYGTVPMPGREVLDLPAGDVTVYYQEDVDLGENENLVPPGNIRLDVNPDGGGRPVKLDPGGFSNEVSGDFGARVSIGDLDVPEDGDYEVTTGPTAQGAAEPAIVLGDDLLDGFLSAVGPGLMVLVGGATVAAVVALVTLVRRRRLTEAGPRMPQ